MNAPRTRVGRWLGFLPFLWRRLRELYVDYRQLSLTADEGLECGRGVQMLGTPLLSIGHGGRVRLGDGVVLDSSNRGYHANMFGPVKLVADSPGALIEIGAATRIHGTCIHARSSVRIGARCLVAANCQILDSDGHAPSFEDVDARIATQGESRPVVIEDAVWLGAGCIVLPGVTIGRGTIVGAGSVVANDLPPMCLAAGVPAKVLRQY